MSAKTTIDEQEIAKFSQQANQWWDQDGPFKTLHEINPIRIEFIKKYTKIKDKKILDVGCGGGILTESLAKLGANVTGLDVGEETIIEARKHATEMQLSIHYVCEPIESFHAADFDVITCMEMLEHVADPALVISSCAKRLKPGGFLFLSTINRTLKAYTTAILAAEYLLNLLPRQTHEYAKFIKPSELVAIVRSAGLDLLGVSGLSYNPFTHHVALNKDVAVNYLMACQKSPCANPM